MGIDGLTVPKRGLRVAFSPGVARWWRWQRLVLKYAKMRLERVIYPDVYCLPFFLASDFDFLLQGQRVERGRYDVILSELPGEDAQLEYLESLVTARLPVAVVPGPPEILARGLTEHKLDLVRRILSGAPHVWAYSAGVGEFYDGLIGRRCATVIPWPFDYSKVARLGREGRVPRADAKVLLQVPLRFCGSTQTFPFILKGLLADVWGSLPREARSRMTFHTFVYTHEDGEMFVKTDFARGLPINLERKMSYGSFVRFVGECGGVVNLTTGSVLGRITFLAAALGKPGIFSSNCELSEALYPQSVVGLFDTGRLRELLAEMLFSIAEGRPSVRLAPRTSLATEIGNFAANALRMREILEGGRQCALSQGLATGA